MLAAHPLRLAYLLDHRNFVAALTVKAARLGDLGYAVQAGETLHLYRLQRGDGDGPRTYLVNPITGACTCPFHRRQVDTEPMTLDGSIVPCKHVLGLGRLVESTLIALRAERDSRYFLLCAWWIATRLELRSRHSPLLGLWPTPDERISSCHSPSKMCESAR